MRVECGAHAVINKYRISAYLRTKVLGVYIIAWIRMVEHDYCLYTKVCACMFGQYNVYIYIVESTSIHPTHIISLAAIKVYFSAVCHMHLCRGLHDHFNQQITPLILRDIKRRQACTNPIRQRLPVTTQMLCQIRQLLLKRAPSYFNTTLWAMCCLAFFGFLRVSEFTIPTEGSYTSLIIYHSKILLLIAGKNPAYSNCS